MDLGEKYKFGLDKRIGDHVNYQTSTLSSEWQFSNQSINPSIANAISSSSPFPPVSSVEATEDKSEQNSSTVAVVKHSPKEGFLHMRARRGQATNSHSLAERVRREKISERMKLLQDLVPGCSKVTGKAVMLDEIINYVQSLQRQVEFLSTKLAAVNPRLDFNIEGLLPKDDFQLRGGLSSAIGFLPEMSYPQLYPSQQSLLQSGIPGMGNSSDALRRAVGAQLTPMAGYKESASQMVNEWDEDLRNIVQMTFGANTSLNTSELISKARNSFPL